MATLTHAESRRLYSWWWDSHNSPKNSKWLQDNLKDMDSKVKSMIKLIEEDADSFARRAEMYYRKRPELMKLVEEFYRAYRALAERYNHATGELRQAHRTMAEAFPNQVPLPLFDDSPAGSSVSEAEPHTPEMPPPIRALFEPDDLQNDALGMSSHFRESDSSAIKKGLKQLNEMFPSEDGVTILKYGERRARKGLSFQADKEEVVDVDQIKNLKVELSHLTAEYQKLKMQTGLETERANKAETEVRSLQETLGKVESGKEATLFQYHQCLERISKMEAEIAIAREENQNLEMRVTSEFERAGKTGSEVESLQKALHRMEAEKESALLRFHQYVEKVSKLETEVSLAEEVSKTLKNEVSSLKVLASSEADCAGKAESEIKRLQKIVDEQEVEKEATLFQSRQGLDRISKLDAEVSHALEESERLKGEVSQLSTENQNLMIRVNSEAERAKKAESETESLRIFLHRVEGEKEAALLQYQQCLERISQMEAKISILVEESNRFEGEVSRLLTDNQYLEVRVGKCESEIERLQNSLRGVEAEKEAALLQYQQCLEKISVLETEISSLLEDSKRLNEEVLAGVAKLNNAEEQCVLLEKANQSLQSEVDALVDKTMGQQEELMHRQEELKNLGLSLQEEREHRMQTGISLQALQNLHTQSEDERRALELELQNSVQILKEVESVKKGLEDEVQQVYVVNKDLEEKNSSLDVLIKNQQIEILGLKEIQGKLEEEVGLYVDQRNAVQKELDHLKEKASDLDQRHSSVVEQVQSVGFTVECFQSSVRSLKDKCFKLDSRKRALEDEVQNVKEQNDLHKNQIASSSILIGNLQNDVLSLKEANKKFEEEIGRHTEERDSLQQGICHLEEEMNDLERRHCDLIQKIESVGLDAECFQSSVQGLRDENSKLKERCMKEEDEKVLLLEKKALLENSLSELTSELDELRQILKTLEDSHQSLLVDNTCLIVDKNSLLSQVEMILQDMEKISEKNRILENSLSDANAELEMLWGKLKSSEELCEAHCNEKSTILAESTSLASQMETTKQGLESLEARFVELEERHTCLMGDKVAALHHVGELESLLKQEKEGHENSVESYKAQVNKLMSQLDLLQQESVLRGKAFEDEQNKVLNSEIEILVLRGTVLDMKEKNFFMMLECQKKMAALKCLDELISELKQENLQQQVTVNSLVGHKNMLRHGIRNVHEVLSTRPCDEICDEIKDKEILQVAVEKIRELQRSYFDVQDELQRLLFERSINFALLQQVGLDLACLKSEKISLDQENKIQSEELLVLQSEKLKLLEMNENLGCEVKSYNQREEEMRIEMEDLHRQLSDSQSAHKVSHDENLRLLGETQAFSKLISDLQNERNVLEEGNSTMLGELLAFYNLYTFFERFSSEKLEEMKLFKDDFDSLVGVNGDLDRNLGEMTEKLGASLKENLLLKDSVSELEQYKSRSAVLEDSLTAAKTLCDALNIQLEDSKQLLVQKEMELGQADQNLCSAESKNTDLFKDLQSLKQELDESKVMIKGLERYIATLSEENIYRNVEISAVREANDRLHSELCDSSRKVKELTSKEAHLSSELQKRMSEAELCEEEVAMLYEELQFSTVQAALLEEKVTELLGLLESLETSSVEQRKMFDEEEASRIAELCALKQQLGVLEGENTDLKANLDAYLPVLLSLQNNVKSLEEKTLLLSKIHVSDNKPTQDTSSANIKAIAERNVYRDPMEQAALTELPKLQIRVQEIERALKEAERILIRDRSEPKAESEHAIQEIEELKSSRSSVHVRDGSPSTILDSKNEGKDISKAKYTLEMKDIQLDHLSESSYLSGVGAKGKIENNETDDQMLELWETAERDCNKLTQERPSAEDIHQIEAVEEEKSEYPSSELLLEKELAVDKLEVSRKDMASRRDPNEKVLEKLVSDAKRLSVLQTGVEELKKKMDNSEKSNRPKSVEFDTLKGQLKEVEESIWQLVDSNTKLTKKIEGFSASFDGKVGESDDTSNARRKQVSERVRRGSEKIGRLELELHRIQYVSLKLEEEYGYQKSKPIDRRSRVLLRDYLYGRREGQGRKKSNFCGCIGSSIKGD
ncbi:hypothetical protein QJS04_geneDACA014570 [Acorus gramineus]|uniref:NAB domain-containing protein n=1 Tax=Acorus gramineus TaxID=55184 RepID=A0AAV9ASL6_ACOGR|nr:hypothetical protein QJS04_geneDACA014570 [Acorus gramineus]